MSKLLNKTVLITGASSGIGESIAYEAAKEDATLILCARRKKELERVKKNCEKLTSASAYVYTMDVSDPSQIEKVINQIHEDFNQIDVLINNAGFGHTKEFLDFDMNTAEKMFRINVLGVMYITQLIALKMVDHRSGHIINMASLAGKISTPKTAVYSATKHAVVGFSDALRLELKPLNVKVTTVNPGPVDTPFFDEFDPNREYISRIDWVLLSDQQVAKKTVKVINTNKREINLPLVLSGAIKVHQLVPKFGDFVISTIFDLK